MDAISQARLDVANIRDRCLKTVSQGAIASAIGSATNQGYGNTLQSHVAQYEAFKGWVFCAVNIIARRIAAQPIYVGRQPKAKSTKRLKFGRKSALESIEPLDSYILTDLINDPNEFASRWSLLYSTAASLKLAGKAFWWLAESDRPGKRFDLWYLPASWVRRSDDDPSIWIVRPRNSTTEWYVHSDQMAYFALPDPADPHRALSPTQAIADSVDVDTKIQRAQSRAFDNGIFPGMAITVGNPDGGPRGKMTTAQRQQFRNAILEQYRGFEKSGMPMILDSLIQDIKPITTAPKEMGFTESEASAKARILQAFGVSEILLGATGSNRAEATVVEDIFCVNVLNPIALMMGQVLTAWIPKAFGDEGLVCCVEPARANDPDLTLKEWQVGLASATVTQNEYRVNVLGLPSVAGGDSYLVPATMTREPVGSADSDSEPGGAGGDD